MIKHYFRKVRKLAKKRLSKRNRILIAVLSVVGVLAIAAALAFGVFGLSLDFSKTLVKVDGSNIKEKEASRYLGFLMQQTGSDTLDEESEEFKSMQASVIDSLIVTKLVNSYASENTIEVQDSEVQEQLDAIISNYETREAFESDMLSSGITENFLKQEIYNQLLRTKIFDKVTADVTANDAELKEYYDENLQEQFIVPEMVQVSHILIKFETDENNEVIEGSKQEALEKIEYIKEELEEGEEFSFLAERFSDDTGSAPNGGDLGYISKGQTVQEFEEAAFNLEVGEVSDIVETEYGYHILKATDYEAEYTQEFDEVEENIRSFLENEKKLKEWEDFIFDLLDKADIEYFIDYETTLIKSDAQS